MISVQAEDGVYQPIYACSLPFVRRLFSLTGGDMGQRRVAVLIKAQQSALGRITRLPIIGYSYS